LRDCGDRGGAGAGGLALRAIASRRRSRRPVSSGLLGPWVQGCSLIHVSKAALREFISFPETFSSILWSTCGAGAAISASASLAADRAASSRLLSRSATFGTKLFGDLLGPRVLGCRAVDRLPLLTHRMNPHQAACMDSDVRTIDPYCVFSRITNARSSAFSRSSRSRSSAGPERRCTGRLSMRRRGRDRPYSR
jgi:hypothetical protein